MSDLTKILIFCGLAIVLALLFALALVGSDKDDEK